MLRNYSPKQVLVNVDHLQAPAQLPSRVSCRHFPKPCLTTKKTKRHGDITKAVAYCIAKDMLPISLVENEGFKNLIHVLDPRYELPGRKHFSQTALPRLYTECRETVERQLQNVQFFATTSDIWSSRTSEPYLSLTIHFVDEDWNLQSKCLQTAYCPEDHTSLLPKE